VVELPVREEFIQMPNPDVVNHAGRVLHLDDENLVLSSYQHRVTWEEENDSAEPRGR
jgi:hypothetical protein